MAPPPTTRGAVAAPARRRRSAATAAAALVLAASAISSCDDVGTTEATVDGYRTELAAICTETADSLAALPTPPEQIPVAEFAVDAASLLTAEAERVRQLAVPDELADDHRAFVQNTDEQAAGWRAVAESAATGATEATGVDVAETDLVALTTRIGELQLGRDDLATEMGVDACRRSTAPAG